MARISYTVENCRDQISPNCTKVFKREVKRGRPQVNCEACKNFKPSKAPRIAKAAEGIIAGTVIERDCPCGKKFTISSGRGRKATKCNDCRSAGIVYRADENGEFQTIRAEALAEEQRELREQAGKDRASRLFDMMQPLLKRKDREVIPH